MTAILCYPDDEKVEAMFMAREEEIGRIKKEMDDEDRSGNKTDLFLVLKHEMVQLMERDVALWQQLKALDNGITTLRHDLIATRCRNNTFSSVIESDQGHFEGEGHEDILTKPRSHTVTSLEGFGTFREDTLSLAEVKSAVSETNKFHIDNDLRGVSEMLGMSNRKHGLLGMFSSFNLKPGLFESGMSRLKNNVFLTGLNSSFIDFIGDLIKPSHCNHILPRRKLHRQCNVLELDDLNKDLHGDSTTSGHAENIEDSQNKTTHDDNLDLQNDESEEVHFQEQTVINNDEYKDTIGNDKDMTKCFNDDIQMTIREEISTQPNDDLNETHTEKQYTDIIETPTKHLQDTDNNAGVEENDNDDLLSSEAIEDEAEIADTEFTYLVLVDGFVSCRIMSPGLEQQIKLKHETEGEPLDYLKCESGFARFRSGSDSESNHSTDSYQSDVGDLSDCDTSDVEELSDCETSDDDTYNDICGDIKRLFDTDTLQDVSNISDNYLDVETFNYDKDETSVLQNAHFQNISIPTDMHTEGFIDHEGKPEASNEESRTETLLYSGNECLEVVNDTKSVISKEYTRDDFGVCVYSEKRCSFTYKISNRISSVDSGIGDEISESFDDTGVM